MKKALKILVGIFIVLGLVFAALELSLNRLVLNGVNAVGPAALGVPVALQGADVSLVRGKAALRGLHVGNPEGYKTDGLLDLGSVSVVLDASTLFSDVIVVRSILIDGLAVTYEKGLLNSNLGALIDQLASGEEETDEAAAEESAAEESAGKKVVIEKLVIADSQMNFSVTGAAALTGGGAIPIPLPRIVLTDLGKEEEGLTLVEAVAHVLKAIAGATGTAIAGAGNLLGDGAGAVFGAGKAVGGGAVGLVAGDADEKDGATAAQPDSGTSSKTAAEALGHLLGKQ